MFTDKVNIVFLIYSIYIVIFVNGLGYITFKNDEYHPNRTCIITNSGLQGICVPLSKCENAQMTLKNHQINPTNCYYNSLEPIVCCSDLLMRRTHTCRKAKIQCVKSNKDIPILLDIDAWEIACKQIVTNFDFGYRGFVPPAFALNAQPTRIGDYPFMAAIGFRQFNGNISYNCGGFLVTKNFVITAAHCTNLGGDIPVVVRTGGIDLDNNTAINLDIPIKKMYIHPFYKSNEAYNDIAVIELVTPSNDTPNCLSEGYFFNYTGDRVIAVGYGQTSFGGPSSNRLLEVDLVVVSNEECQKYYPINSFLPNGIQQSQTCAIDMKKVKTQDTCQGDSGGPLLTMPYGLSYPFLYGVTSFGDFCGSKTPGVYTKINYYLDWLESIIWSNI